MDKLNVLASRLFSRKNFKNLLPVQKACLQPIANGKDVIVTSPTGSGKTLAYLLPLIHRLETSGSGKGGVSGRFPRALILAPHRELALQIEREILQFGKQIKTVNTFVKHGELSLVEQLSRGTDVVVGTPARVTELRGQRHLKLDSIESVVIDEADLMLHYGYLQPLYDLLQKLLLDQTRTEALDTLPEPKWQTCLFSATLPSWIADVSKLFMRPDPVKLEFGTTNGRASQNTDIRHLGIPIAHSKDKLATLANVLSYCKQQKLLAGDVSGEFSFKALVFVSKRQEAEEIAAVSQIANMNVGILHGQLDAAYRDATLQQFRRGNLRLVVATDIAARGIDIPNVDVVVQWSPPLQPGQFVHRAGRTGRAGRSGLCVTFYSTSPQNDQVRLLEDIESALSICISRVRLQTESMVKEQAKSIRKYIAEQLLVSAEPKHKDSSDGKNTFFHRAARELLQLQVSPEDIIASVMARLAGYSSPAESLPPDFGLLTGREDMTTLHFSGGYWSHFRKSVLELNVELWAAVADELGQDGRGAFDRGFNRGYRIVKDGPGIVMDCSNVLARKLLQIWPESGSKTVAGEQVVPKTLCPCLWELPPLLSLSEQNYGGALLPTVRRSFEIDTVKKDAEKALGNLKLDVSKKKAKFVEGLKSSRRKQHEKQLLKRQLARYVNG